MSFIQKIAATLILLLSPALYADHLIIEPDMGRAPIINAIKNAHQSVKLVMYGFTDQQILDAINQQKQSGKTIQVILEETPYKADDENKKTIANFNAEQINWHASLPPFKLVHQKTLVIDDKQAIVMTFNFTNSTFKKERNFALVLDNADDVNAVNNLFTSDWNNKTPLIQNNHLVVSPDNSRDKMIELVNHAKQSIWVYAQNVSDYKIMGALAKAAQRGVDVKLLTSSKLKDKAEQYLKNANVAIYYSKEYIIHAKVFIIDKKEALLGSINLTRASLDDNRELSIITNDNKIVSQLTSTFESDWKGESNKSLPAFNNLFTQLKKIGIRKLQHELMYSLNTNHHYKKTRKHHQSNQYYTN